MMEGPEQAHVEAADEELIKRFLDGETGAFEILFSRYRHKMFSLAYRLCGNSSEAEDMSQEIFLLAYRKVHTFKGESQFSTWLYRLGINRCRDHLRKRGRRREVLPMESTIGEGGEPLSTMAPTFDDPDEPHRHLVASETQKLVQEAINELPPSLRMPLVLHDINGLHYREIAGILKIPVGTVKSRIFRGRSRLGESLEPHKELWRD